MMLSPYLAKSIANRWPYRGRQRLAAWLGAKVSRMPEGDIHVTPDGRKFKLRKDAMYLRLFLDEDFSLDETRMFTHLSKAGDCVADVGANCGFYSVLFARQVGSTGHVHAFEPAPGTFEELLEHIALNDVESVVTANRMALADKPQTRSLYSFAGRAHGLSSFANVYNAKATPTSVAALTLDDYMRSNGISTFALVKIDVEGAEWEVLRGARCLLDSEQPPMLSIEMNDVTSKAFGYAPFELLRFLRDAHAYDIFQVFRHGYFVSLTTLEDYHHGEMVLCAKSKAHATRIAELPHVMASTSLHAASESAARDPAHKRSPIAKCPMCGSLDHEFHHRGFDDRYGMAGDFDVRHCGSCGGYFMAEHLSAPSRVYEQFYSAAPAQPNHAGLLRQLRLQLRNTALWHSITGGVDLSGYVLDNEDVLDVGCGYATNAYAIIAKKASWFGIDVDPKVAAFLKQAGLPHFCGQLEEFASSSDKAFDTVLMSQVLEHTPDPVGMLQAARKCLRSNGRILIACPNASSRFRLRYDEKWIHWHVPYHIVQFTPDALKHTAKRANLTVQWLQTRTPASWYLCQRRVKAADPGRVNPSFGIPFEPLKWAALSPWLALQDRLSFSGGDALIACLTPNHN